MTITVYGPGCRKCKQAEEVARRAIAQAGIEAEVVKVEDIAEMAKIGVLMTPAVVIDGKVVVSGKVPSVSELVAHIGGASEHG